MSGYYGMEPYYEQDGVTILHANCFEARRECVFDDVGLILTDPPYGIGYKSSHNTGWPKRGDRYERWNKWRRDTNFAGIAGDDEPFDPEPWLVFARHMAVFGGNYCADRLPPSRCWYVWDKNCGKTRSTQSDCELIWTTFGKPARVFQHLWRGICRAGEENVSRGPKLHPHQKPLALLRFLLTEWGGMPGEHVLDPFMGSGSTLVAARQMGYSVTATNATQPERTSDGD